MTKAGMVLAVVALGTFIVQLQRGPSYDNGPFGALGGAASGWSTGVAPGTTFTDGSLVLQNHTSEALTLINARFAHGAPGLEQVGAKVAGIDRAIGSYQMLPSFPPSNRPPDVVLGLLADLEGYVIPAGGEYVTHGVEVLFGIKKVSPGRATRRAVLVTYEIDGRRAVARIVSTLAVCDADKRTSCSPEYADER